jgi:hypothetical protein
MKNINPTILAAIILAATFAIFTPKFQITSLPQMGGAARVNVITGHVTLCRFAGDYQC